MTIKIKGVVLNLNGTNYTVPPLNLRSLETMQDALSDFTGGIDAKSVSTVVDAAYAALKRNYPDMTRDEVAEIIDVGNMVEVMQAIMDVSGLMRKEQEAQGGASGESSAGAASTPT
jgi:hypothetical protein